MTTLQWTSWLKLSCSAALAAASFGAAGCGGDDVGASKAGGSCVNQDGCFEVTDPPDYDVASECSFSQSTWSAQSCDPELYARKCTQVTQISSNGGPEREVIYVYFWPADSNFGCLGTEEML